MSMQSLALLPELQNLPAAENALDLGFTDTVTRLRGMDKDHFAIELAEGIDETADVLFDALPNVPDEYPLKSHEHYQEMVERGDSSVTGFLSNLKGKVAEMRKTCLKITSPDMTLA